MPTISGILFGVIYRHMATEHRPIEFTMKVIIFHPHNDFLHSFGSRKCLNLYGGVYPNSFKYSASASTKHLLKYFVLLPKRL